MSLEAAIEFIIKRRENRTADFSLLKDIWKDLIKDIKDRLVEDAKDVSDINYYKAFYEMPLYSRFRREVNRDVFSKLGPLPYDLSTAQLYASLNRDYTNNVLSLIESAEAQRVTAHEAFMSAMNVAFDAVSEYMFKLRKPRTKDIIFLIYVRDSLEKVELNNYTPLIDILDKIAVYQNKN